MKQKEAIWAYCDRLGISKVEFFIDDSLEKCVLDRDEYKRLKAAIEQDTDFEPVFLVQGMSKLTRNMNDAVQVMKEMEKLGAECHTVDGPFPNLPDSLLADLSDIANKINPDYLDKEDGYSDLFPKLVYIAPLDDNRTALLMSDRKIYQIQNEELGELMGLDFKAEYCSIGDNGRKIVMEDFDRRFSVADIKGFMKPLPVNNHFGYDEHDGELIVNKLESEIVRKVFELVEAGKL